MTCEQLRKFFSTAAEKIHREGTGDFFTVSTLAERSAMTRHIHSCKKCRKWAAKISARFVKRQPKEVVVREALRGVIGRIIDEIKNDPEA
jgi:hypothetical protein